MTHKKVVAVTVIVFLFQLAPYFQYVHGSHHKNGLKASRMSRGSDPYYSSASEGHPDESKKSYVVKIIDDEHGKKESKSIATTPSPKTNVIVRKEKDAEEIQPQSRGRSLSPREAQSSKNWYAYKSENTLGRSLDGGGASASGGGCKLGGCTDGSGGGDGSGASGGGGISKKKGPYGVRRAKSKDKIDPSGYNFFQFQPRSKVGFLWITGNLSSDSSGRTDSIGGDDSTDDDDLDPANKYDWEFRRYDRACLYVEYKLAKADVPLPSIPVETKRLVDNQNKLLARRFLNWTFETEENETSLGGDPSSASHYTFLFLQETKNIFMNKICKNASNYAFASSTTAASGAAATAMNAAKSGGNSTEFLPEGFVSYLFKLFMVLRDITAPKNIPEYPTEKDKLVIIDDILKNCSDSEESIHWFAHSCRDQVLSYDQKNNYACTPMHDYDFNPKLYDPILDAVWHMFNAVHSYCFKYFQVNPRMWHRYSLIMANTFTEQMRQRWKSSAAPEKFYMRLLGPEHIAYLETINRCMYGAVLRTDTPMLIPRFDTPSPITFAPISTMVDTVTATATAPAPPPPSSP